MLTKKDIQNNAASNLPKPGTRFWHKEYNEYCYLEKILPNGMYLCCLNPRRADYDDYYSYSPDELIKK